MSLAKQKLYKLIFTVSVFFGFAFLLGFSYKYHLPQLEQWLLLETERASAKYTDFRVWPEKLKISVFPLGVRMHKIKLMPNSHLRTTIAPAFIEEAQIELSLIDLLRGRIHIDEIFLKNPDVILFVREQGQKQNDNVEKTKSKKASLRQLADIPVSKINIQGLKLKADIQPYNLRIKTDDINLTLENRFKALLVDIHIPDLQTKLYDQSYVLQSLIEARFLVQDNSLNVSALKIKQDESFVVGSGVIDGQILDGVFKSAKGSLRTSLDLASAIELAKKLDPQISLPKANGMFSLDTTISYNQGQSPTANYSLKTQDVDIEGFKLGNLTAIGQYLNQQVSVSKAQVQNSAGQVNIANLKMGTTDEIQFSADINVQNLELRELLSNLQVTGVPLRLDMSGSLPCSGQIKNFSLKCKGVVMGRNLHVWTGDDKSTIVKSKDFKATGEVTVDLNEVKYNADLELGDAKGKSNGIISYAKGFDINYETDNIDFKEITNLVNLKLEGSTSLKGRTWGDSNWARIDMNVDTSDVWLEDHALGKTKSRLNYKEGQLYFRGIKGSINNSLYSGVVSIDVLKSEIYLNLSSKYLNLDDVQFAFSRRGKLPFDFTGTGSARVKAWGPLQFNKLSYDLETELYRGTLFNESFDEIKGSLSADTGMTTIKNLVLNKGNSYARFSGTIDPKGTLDARIIGSNFRLVESKKVSDWGLNLEGRLDAMMQLTGFILTPNLKIDGNLKEVLIAGEPQKDSSFSLNYNDFTIEGNGQFLGKTINTQFNIPLKEHLPFSFRMSAKDWDFIKMFNLVSNSALKRNYRTRLSLDVDLKSDKGGFWNSSGHIEIPDVRVQRNNLVMFNEKPMSLTFRNGIVHANQFRVINDEGDFVELNTTGMTQGNVNAEMRGQFDLGLAAILTPLEDVGGDINFTVNTKGPFNKINVIGDAFIKNSFARIANFPHVFEELNADILFNENRLLINAARARLAEGQVTGSGRLLFNGFKDIPIDIRADITNAKFNIPEGIKTEGSATLYIAGKWFPYTLGGTYTVNRGIIETEFDAGNSNGNKIQPSNFLPRFLNQERFAPLTLNLDVILANPVTIRNSLANIPLDGRVKVTGPIESPHLTGQFDLQAGGKLNFRESEFDLQSGSAVYRDSPPENPELNVTASTVLESQDVNYDVSLLLQGNANNPRIRLSSSPPLEELDIISLLGFGYTRSDLEQINQTEQAAQTSFQIGSALLASPLGKQIKSRFGLDMQISSELDENNKTEPKLTLKKQINNKFNASASRTLGKTPRTKITGEYNINNNLSVIGFFDSTEPNTEEEKDKENLDTIGLDLEYKIQFK
ncbi:MAG: translocation/assembly module TamB [Bdellovibrionales bacterium]